MEQPNSARSSLETPELNDTQTGQTRVGAVEPVALADRCWKAAITGSLFVVLFREELLRLIARWQTPDESHGMLIPAFSLYFVYQQRERLRRTVGQASYVGLLVMILSVAGYLFSVRTSFYYPRQIAMIAMIGGMVLFLGGWRIVRLVWLPVVYLIFAMPLPGRYHEMLTMPLRILASQIAALILGLFPNIYCEATNVVITGSYQGQAFNLNVAEACSGMRLLLTFVALGVAMAYLEYRPVVHRLILLCSTVPIAIFCNIVRVLLTGMIHIYVGPQYAEGTLHTVLGMIMLLLAFGLYGLLAWIMNNLFEDDQSNSGDVLVVRKGS